ncbi:MAG: N-acetylmuramoyl-L-alanine amidase [Longimicrobiales bacterium]
MKSVLPVLIVIAAAGCASGGAGPTPAPTPVTAAAAEAGLSPRGSLPPIPSVDGPLRIRIAYPDSNAALAVRDSNFIFGSVGSGRATLTINGAPVPVAPNGAFLGFVPVPADGTYRLQATKNGETQQAQRVVRVPGGGTATSRTRISSTSPSGTRAVIRGANIEVSMRATVGGTARFVTADGMRYPLVENRVFNADAAPGADFQMQPSTAAPTQTVTYSGVVPVLRSWSSADTSVARSRLQSRGVVDTSAAAAAGNAHFEIIVGADTVVAPARLNITALATGTPIIGVVQAPPGSTATWRTRGRIDTSGPFNYFWPAGTRFQVLGERDGFFQVRLAGNRTAYVPASEIRLLPVGTPTPGGGVASVRFSAKPDYVDLRIPLPELLPFEVREDDHTINIDVFGAVSQVNFFQYGTLDPLVQSAEWSAPADSTFRVTVHLSHAVWGYDTFFDAGGTLILRIRRPPLIDRQNPLRGLLIAVDPGHPPGGAIGPTGLTEAEANLSIGLKLRDMLQAAGARVLMTRTDATAVPLNDRPQMAADANAQILISIHNNAFPDGVNPFRNNGTSAYYFHPQSVQLARLLQAEILAALGLRDIGIGRADLALVRATWMPAVLTETSFLMIPEQEAAMRDPAVHERVARAHLRALEAFLRERAR